MEMSTRVWLKLTKSLGSSHPHYKNKVVIFTTCMQVGRFLVANFPKVKASVLRLKNARDGELKTNTLNVDGNTC